MDTEVRYLTKPNLKVIQSRALTLSRYQPVACHSSIGSRLLLNSNELDEYS